VYLHQTESPYKPPSRAPYGLAWATFCITFLAVFTAESAVLSAALAVLR
jgi:hypothetical protein